MATGYEPEMCPHSSEGERVWEKGDFTLVEEDLVRDRLAKINAHKSMGPNGMHPCVLRELTGYC